MRIDRVRVEKLLSQGKSNLEIAAALGCAPNSITQIKRELGFPVQPWKGDGRPKKAGREKAQRNGARKGSIASSVKARNPVPLPPRATELPVQHYRGECKWPVDGPVYAECGAPAVMGKPYCDEHCARAYVGKSAGQGMTLPKLYVPGRS